MSISATASARLSKLSVRAQFSLALVFVTCGTSYSNLSTWKMNIVYSDYRFVRAKTSIIYTNKGTNNAVCGRDFDIHRREQSTSWGPISSERSFGNKVTQRVFWISGAFFPKYLSLSKPH